MVNITDAHKNLNYAHGSVCVGMIVWKCCFENFSDIKKKFG